MKFTLAWARTSPPSESRGWTITFIERGSRYWIEAEAGVKTTDLFKQATNTAWSWAKTSQYIRWFTDGERRYAQQLWKMASVYLKSSEVTREYGHRKVWRHGLEVAMKIKGSQGIVGSNGSSLSILTLPSAIDVRFMLIIMKQTTVP